MTNEITRWSVSEIAGWMNLDPKGDWVQYEDVAAVRTQVPSQQSVDCGNDAKETLRQLGYIWVREDRAWIVNPIRNPPAPPAGISPAPLAGVSDIDMVHAAFQRHGYRKGTPEGIAFNNGARWLRALSQGDVSGDGEGA